MIGFRMEQAERYLVSQFPADLVEAAQLLEGYVREKFLEQPALPVEIRHLAPCRLSLAVVDYEIPRDNLSARSSARSTTTSS